MEDKENYSKKFAKVPKQIVTLGLKQGDILVFAHIRIHYNAQTGLCNPGIDTISKESKYSSKFIYGSIKRLEKAGLFKVERRKGASNRYIFTEKGKQFERFAEDFLKIQDLTTHTKEFYMRIQEYLFVHEDGTADTTYDPKQLADLTGLDLRSVKKYLAELKEKSYLKTEEATTTNVAGLVNTKYVFQLDKLGQQILYKLKEHEDRLNKCDDKVEKLEQSDYEKTKRIISLEKQVDYLTRQLRLANVKEVPYTKIETDEIYTNSYKF